MGGKGSGGSNAKPTAIKKLQGNPGKRKLNTREPAPKKGTPVMPDELDAGAQQEWNRIIPLLEQMNVLSEVDSMALAGYCSAVSLWFKAEKMLSDYGPVIVEKRPAGAVLKINPAARVRSDALKQMNTFLGQFGLSPASRTRIQTNSDGDPQDPLSDFLDRKSAGEVVQ